MCRARRYPWDAATRSRRVTMTMWVVCCNCQRSATRLRTSRRNETPGQQNTHTRSQQTLACPPTSVRCQLKLHADRKLPLQTCAHVHGRGGCVPRNVEHPLRLSHNNHFRPVPSQKLHQSVACCDCLAHRHGLRALLWCKNAVFANHVYCYTQKYLLLTQTDALITVNGELITVTG